MKLNRVSWIFIFIGVLGIFDTLIILSLSGGINVGTLLPGILGLALILWGMFRAWYKQLPLKRFLWLRRLIRAGLLLLIASFILIEGLLIANTHDPMPDDADYMIILGAGLNGDQLSLTLWERLHKGVGILQENEEMKVVVTGGQGPGEWITEAEAMQRYLVKQGIAPERIIKEERSTSTMENFKFSKDLLLEQQEFELSKPILVITNDFHMFRSKILAKRNGLNPVGVPSPTPWYLVPNVYLREYFAVVKSMVFDW